MKKVNPKKNPTTGYFDPPKKCSPSPLDDPSWGCFFLVDHARVSKVGAGEVGALEILRSLNELVLRT